MKIDGELSKDFEVKVGVYQGSAVNPHLYAVVMDEVTKDVRERGMKELIYSNDLMILGGSWKGVEIRYARWKKAMTE